jgi:hypothetical protein
MLISLTGGVPFKGVYTSLLDLDRANEFLAPGTVEVEALDRLVIAGFQPRLGMTSGDEKDFLVPAQAAGG